ncbi:MAG TPA: hypothetical protein PLW68_03670 [Casimicrobiaceae bacterium]|nr:hypothetical protein [Casimicrobiaceae bacterium]
MKPSLSALILAGAAGLFAASAAQAVICYVVYDRGENVIYQNTYPPVDMSSAGMPERDAMRARGEHMTFGDVNTCPTMVFLAGTAGSIAPSLDEVVAGMPASVSTLPLSSRGSALAPAPSKGKAR